jgi:hypothetical protein
MPVDRIAGAVDDPALISVYRFEGDAADSLGRGLPFSGVSLGNSSRPGAGAAAEISAETNTAVTVMETDLPFHGFAVWHRLPDVIDPQDFSATEGLYAEFKAVFERDADGEPVRSISLGTPWFNFGDLRIEGLGFFRGRVRTPSSYRRNGEREEWGHFVLIRATDGMFFIFLNGEPLASLEPSAAGEVAGDFEFEISNENWSIGGDLPPAGNLVDDLVLFAEPPTADYIRRLYEGSIQPGL